MQGRLAVKPKGLYVLRADAFDTVYGPHEQEEIAGLLDIAAEPQTKETLQERPELLADVEIILSGWGAPTMDEAFLACAPNLKAVFYGAGSTRRVVTEAFWQRGILVTSAYAANAVPVAEYTLATILLSLKRFWQLSSAVRREGAYPLVKDVPGAYGTTVGLVSLGKIGRLVRERLRPFALNVLAYDPKVSEDEANDLNVEAVSLEALFERADVVSLHTPWLKETEGLIGGAHLASMKTNATLINTARGAIIREGEMLGVLRERPDLYAVLDVTYPEPPEPGSDLYTLPNVVLSPHIAGSLGGECRRMGRVMVEELRRYLAGEPLRWAISEAEAKVMA